MSHTMFARLRDLEARCAQLEQRCAALEARFEPRKRAPKRKPLSQAKLDDARRLAQHIVDTYRAQNALVVERTASEIAVDIGYEADRRFVRSVGIALRQYLGLAETKTGGRREFRFVPADLRRPA